MPVGAATQTVQRYPHVFWSGSFGAPETPVPRDASALRVVSARSRPRPGRVSLGRCVSFSPPPQASALQVVRPRSPRRTSKGEVRVFRLGAPASAPPTSLMFGRSLQLRGSRQWRSGRALPSRTLGFLRYELRQAVVAWLGTLTNLQSLISGRIYFEDPSQLAKYPCLAVQVTKRGYGHNHSGPDGTSQATVQMTGLALKESQAIAIAEAIRNSADGFRGIQYGVPILRCFLSDEGDGSTPPPDGSDQWIYQVALEYDIAHRV